MFAELIIKAKEVDEASHFPIPIITILVKAFLARDKVDTNNMEFRLMQWEKAIAERELRHQGYQTQAAQHKFDKIDHRLQELIQERRAMGRGSVFIRTQQVPPEWEYTLILVQPPPALLSHWTETQL